MYIERQLEKKFIAVSEEYACVLLTGPRQVGKSTMLRHLMEGTARAEVSLDDLEERRLAKTDPAMFLKLHPAPVLIDEVQYAPELFSYIKIAVDNGAAPGSYWLTGSQAYRLMALAQESLAGRTAMYAPEDNYIYKYSEAAQMAAYGEYGFDIGSGGHVKPPARVSPSRKPPMPENISINRITDSITKKEATNAGCPCWLSM